MRPSAKAPPRSRTSSFPRRKRASATVLSGTAERRRGTTSACDASGTLASANLKRLPTYRDYCDAQSAIQVLFGCIADRPAGRGDGELPTRRGRCQTVVYGRGRRGGNGAAIGSVGRDPAGGMAAVARAAQFERGAVHRHLRIGDGVHESVFLLVA